MSADLARRRALRGLCGLGLVPLAASCRHEPPPDVVRVPLGQLEGGRRVRVVWRGEPVEVRQTPAGPAARSLLCTHFGCPLAWDETRRRHVCPCHGGEFDDEGRPVAGPPNRPLAEVPVKVLAGEAVVGLS